MEFNNYNNKIKKFLRDFCKLSMLFLMVFVVNFLVYSLSKKGNLPSEGVQIASVAMSLEPEWHYRFQIDGILEETGLLSDSSSPYWWLNSGGRMIIKNGIGNTIHENFGISSFWKLLYKDTNPTDTDEGEHPQNIFRLLTRKKWQSSVQEFKFVINAIRMSSSSNRNESNGVLLLSRYVDSNNLYYSGVRVDGNAVIKKKKSGIYYTLAEKKIFSSEASYNRDTNPNLIPGFVWIGLRSEIHTDSSGNTIIKLYIDKSGNGTWQEVLTAIDDNKTFGGPSINEAGLLGIRTDFIDASFDDYKVTSI